MEYNICVCTTFLFPIVWCNLMCEKMEQLISVLHHYYILVAYVLSCGDILIVCIKISPRRITNLKKSYERGFLLRPKTYII